MSDLGRVDVLKTYVVGSGVSLPENIVSNEDLALRLDLDPKQIFKSSGIRNRRWASEGTSTSSLASAALESALENAGLVTTDIDYLLLGTMTPDRLIPGSAPSVQKALGLNEIPCLDIHAACCNALYGLQLAQALVRSGIALNVAICLADIQSVWLDHTASGGTTSMLFGDGASSLIVSSNDREGALEILDIFVATDGTYVDDLGIRCPGTEFGTVHSHASDKYPEDYFPRMIGQSVILQASRKMTAACQHVLERNHLSISEVKWLVPHQANTNLLAQVARSLRFPAEQVVNLLEELGNTSSASMGIALNSLRRSGRIQSGDHLLLPAFGAGFTWGAGLCRA